MFSLRRLTCYSRRINPTRCQNISNTSGSGLNRLPIDIAEEVQYALQHKRPVVALETALVTHGIPAPKNMEVAQSLEKIVRGTGAVPATIGLIDGRIKVGLNTAELERLADTSAKSGSVKVSRRDIAAALALKRDGGTTIAGTMVIAHLAGIKVFATGGLGGVHRNGQNTMDISADLTELGRTPVAVITGGVKSILDIKRTLEYLETQGVPVFSYAATNDFPAFFSPVSGHKTPWNVNIPSQAAEIIHNGDLLGMHNGHLFCAPIPEQWAESGKMVQEFVNQAVAESEQNGIDQSGNDATPWLLQRVFELSQGQSLLNNIALLENTALIGGQIAVEYAKLRVNAEDNMDMRVQPPSVVCDVEPTYQDKPPAQLIVIGSAAIDIISKVGEEAEGALIQHSTVPGSVSSTLGGVARNVAEAAHRLLSQSPEASTLLISPVGEDSFARTLISETEAIGMRTDGFITIASSDDSPQSTSVCNMLLDAKGSLLGGVADMAIIQKLDPSQVSKLIGQHIPKVVLLDANISEGTLAEILRECNRKKIVSFFEPTSVIKSTRIVQGITALLNDNDLASAPVCFASPNLQELEQIFHAVRDRELCSSDYWWQFIEGLALGFDFQSQLEQLSRLGDGELGFLVQQGVAQMAIHLLPFFQHLLIKCGDKGVVTVFHATSSWSHERSHPPRRRIVAHGKNGTVVVQHFPAMRVTTEEIINVTGAGDSLVGSVVASLVDNPSVFDDPVTLARMMERAQQAAALSFKSRYAVSPLLGSLLQ